MLDDYFNSPEHVALYDILLEELELSEEALRVIKRTGITTVGDCVDFFMRGSDAMITVRFGFWQVMESEVLPKLEEHGYWPPDNAES